jgi:Tfp pilus assembly pilus retraction ATPase PilT
MPFSFQQHSQSSVELNQIEQIKQLNELLAQLIPQLMVLKVADVHINFIDGKIDMLLRYQGYLMTLQEFMEKPNNNMLFNQNELTLLTSLKLTGDFHDFEQLIAQLPYDFSWFDTLSGVRLRINQSKAYDVSGVKYVWVMRIIQSHILSLQEIGLQNKKSVIESWLAQSQGLILITGATGSGKSLSLIHI